MKKLVLIVCVALFLSNSALSQGSFNVTYLGNWDNENLPVHSGNTYNDIWGFVYDYKEYAILGSVGRTHFIDVSNPPFLQEVISFPSGINTIWRDFKTYGHYAYGVADQSTPSNPNNLQIFDYSGLPDTIVKVFDANTFFQTAHNIFIDEKNGRLYVVGSDTRPNGIIVLDLTANPASPTLLASVNLPGGYVHDVYVRDNIAYCSHGFSGLYIYDMTNPTTPVLLGNLTSYPFQGYNHASWLSDDGNFLVFADESFGRPLRIVDITDLSDLSIVSTFHSALLAPAFTNSIAHNPFVRDGYAFVSYYHDGLQIFDISDVLEPVRVAYYDTHANTDYNGYDGAWGVYPFLPSHNILISDQLNGLFVVKFDGLDPKPGMMQGVNVQDANSIQLSENEKPVIKPGDLQFDGQLHTGFELYPNPVKQGEVLRLSLSSSLGSGVKATLFDLNGRPVSEHKLPAISPGQVSQIHIKSVPPGVYTLVISGGELLQRAKVVIQE